MSRRENDTFLVLKGIDISPDGRTKCTKQVGKGMGQKRKPGPIALLSEPAVHMQSTSKRWGTGTGLEKESRQLVQAVRTNPGDRLQTASELQLHITSCCTVS